MTVASQAFGLYWAYIQKARLLTLLAWCGALAWGSASGPRFFTDADTFPPARESSPRFHFSVT